MKLRQHNKKDLHPHKVFHQFFNPHNEEQEKKANEIRHSAECLPLNTNTNCRELSEAPVSFNSNMSNKEFYAMRRGKQNRFLP